MDARAPAIPLRPVTAVSNSAFENGLWVSAATLARISASLVKKGDMLSQADVIEILALEMLGAIPLDDQVIATTNKGVPAVLENKCVAAKEFIRIAKKLAGHEVEDEAVGFFTRIGRALGLSATPA